MRKTFTMLALVAAFLFGVAPLALAQSAAPAPDVGQLLWAAVLGAGPLLWPIINRPFVSFLTELTKRLPAVPIPGNTHARQIVGHGADTTRPPVVCNFLVAWLSGNAASFDMANAAMVLAQVIGSVLTAAGSFGLWKKKATT